MFILIFLDIRNEQGGETGKLQGMAAPLSRQQLENRSASLPG
jgi:hypothetical protein